MGLLNWLVKRQVTVAGEDSVWVTAAARLEGLCARVARHAADRQVIALAHFPRSLEALTEALAPGVSFERARYESDVASCLTAPRTGSVCLALVSQLPAALPTVSGEPTTRVSFLVAERHPLRSQDEIVETLAGALPQPASVRFHLALDDELLERFAGERLNALLEQLGVAEDEELSHSGISGAIKRAQAKLAEQSPSSIEAESTEDWFEKLEPR
jgi:hypothetical protein